MICCKDLSASCAVLSTLKQLGVAGKCNTIVEINSLADLFNSSDSLSLISVGDGDLETMSAV